MIPKVIVQYWDQEVIPDDVSSLMLSWKRQHSGYEYVLFNKTSARSFIKKNCGKEGLSIFDAANIPAMRSDIFRLAYILHHGGVYIDAATKSVACIDCFIKKNDQLYLMRKWHGGIWNGFIAAAAFHPVLKEVWNQVVSNVKVKRSNDVWAVTGPGVFNEIVGNAEKYNSLITVANQRDVKKFFLLINDLEHKGSNHWSKVQKKQSIFREKQEKREENNLRKQKTKIAEVQKVVLHLGPHKTGTTSFQNMLEENESQLHDAGLSLFTVRSCNSNSYKIWRNEYTKILQGFLLGKMSEKLAVDSLVEKFIDFQNLISDSCCKGIILSDENLLGPVPGHFYAGCLGRERNFYSAHKVVFSAIKIAFSSKTLQVLVCEREFDDFIVSSYRDYVFKLKSSERPKDFVGGFDQNIRAGFKQFYIQFSSIFAEEGRVLVFSNFIESMCQIVTELTGVEVALKTFARNKSPGWRAAELALEIAPLLNTDKERNDFSRFLANKIEGKEQLGLRDEMVRSLAKLRQ